MTQQQPILNIKMVPGGIDMVIKALMQLPYGEVAVLIAEIRGQADEQMRAPAVTPEAPVAPKPRKERPKKTKPQDLGTVGA